MTKIAIIGSGQTREGILARLTELGETDVVVMTPEEYAMTQTEVHKQYIENYYESIGELRLIGEKRFKCKGKHQYREQDGAWVCECGRKL